MMKITTSTLIKQIHYYIFFLLCLLPSVVWAEEKLCPNLKKFEEEMAGFWPKFCFEIMRDIFCKLADLCWSTFASPLQGLIAVGAGIYIAIYTLRTLSSFSQQDIAAYFSNTKTGLFLLMGKVAFIFILLSNEDFVYQYLVTPIIQAGATIGRNDWGENFADVKSVRLLFDKVIEQIENFDAEVDKIIAMGRLMICMTSLPETIIDWHWKFLPFGGALYAFGQMIVIFLAFYMMDIIFRLGVGCVLLPFGIACGVSKLTSHYTKQLWNLFINVAFNFILIKIIMDFSLQMIMYSLKGLVTAKVEAILLKATGFLNDADANEFLQALTMDAFVLLSLACVIALKLFLDVETIAEKLSDAPGVGKLAQSVGGDMATITKNAALDIAKQPVNFAAAAAEEAGATSVRQMKRGWKWFKNHI